MPNATVLLNNISSAPSEEEISKTKIKVDSFIKILKTEIKKSDIFVGGSFAKGTLVKKNIYDVDIFTRFDKKELNLIKLEKAVKKVSKILGYEADVVHGSRDYLRVKVDNGTLFEIVPALKITNPKYAENVIDLSYFHVSYVRNKIKKDKRLAREIQIAKTFLAAQEIYGAESYIRGFSGYAVECLIINYRSFLKFLEAVSKSKDKIVLDPARHYKKNAEIMYHLNESKTMGPLVLVDPTWKERNVTAAVSQEAFDKLKKAAKRFLKAPNRSFFEIKTFSVDKFKEKKRNEEKYACISLETEKQEGDIAGTKLKKYANYLLRQMGKNFEIINSHFEYNGEKVAKIHIILVPKKEIIIKGPPIKMKKSVYSFKKVHKKTFVKAGILYSNIKLNYSLDKMLKEFIKKEEKIAKQMSIVNIKLMY